MKKTIIICAVLTWYVNICAQEVVFSSKEFEMGVKIHLGIEENDKVEESQVDTITSIDLSRLGIRDISDVLWLTHVQEVDLSDNLISDITPLAMLDSLRILNLGDNEIEDLCPLLFSHADSMEVDVINNYIDDFSCLFRPTRCLFTLSGVAGQKVKNAPYFNVYQLYVAVNEKDEAEAVYQAYTNIDRVSYVQCGNSKVSAQIDGKLNSFPIQERPVTTTSVILSNGDKYDVTYFVPPTFHQVDAGQTNIIETGLPENYYIGMVKALHGEGTSEGNILKYSAPNEAVPDTLYFSYYQGSQLRGFSQFYIGLDPNGIRKISDKSNVNIELRNHILSVKCNSPELSQESIISVYDTTGRLLVSKYVDSSNGIDAELFVRHTRNSVLIVQVESGRKKWIEKVISIL